VELRVPGCSTNPAILEARSAAGPGISIPWSSRPWWRRPRRRRNLPSPHPTSRARARGGN